MTDGELFALMPDDLDWRQMELASSPAHTAQRLKANDPRTYERCRRLLAGGVDITLVADSMNVGENTLYRIIANELGGIDEYHKRLGEECGNVAMMGVARIKALLPHEKNLTAVTIATGTMIDKHLAAKGMPSLVVEHRHTGDHDEKIAQLNAMAAQVRERLTQGRVVEMPAIETEEAVAA